MNERIQELALQVQRTEMPGVLFAHPEFVEKFAELIVKECIVDFYRRYLDICSDEDITVQVERYVKEYFGIGE